MKELSQHLLLHIQTLAACKHVQVLHMLCGVCGIAPRYAMPFDVEQNVMEMA